MFAAENGYKIKVIKGYEFSREKDVFKRSSIKKFTFIMFHANNISYILQMRFYILSCTDNKNKPINQKENLNPDTKDLYLNIKKPNI